MKVPTASNLQKAVEILKKSKSEALKRFNLSNRNSSKYLFVRIEGQEIDAKIAFTIAMKLDGDINFSNDSFSSNSKSNSLFQNAFKDAGLHLIDKRKAGAGFNENDDGQTGNRRNRSKQAKFRDHMLKHVSNECEITGFKTVEALEVAHLTPFSETLRHNEHDAVVLRVDLHRLHDRQLLRFKRSKNQLTVQISKKIHDEYGEFHGRQLTRQFA